MPRFIIEEVLIRIISNEPYHLVNISSLFLFTLTNLTGRGPLRSIFIDRRAQFLI